jgi:methionyl-tRNA formyltransferase
MPQHPYGRTGVSALAQAAAIAAEGAPAQAAAPPPRIVLFATPCAFSQIIIARLIAAGIIPCAIIRPGPLGSSILPDSISPESILPSSIPSDPIPLGLFLPSSIPSDPIPAGVIPLGSLPYRRTGVSAPAQAAASAVEAPAAPEIPILTIQRDTIRELLPQIASLKADLACVACFPWRIPASLITALPYGILNIHPSLLPNHRGPDPLFWSFWHGELTTGITIHAIDALDEGFDTGPIVAQQTMALPEGIHYASAEQQLAQLGADLLIELIRSGKAISGARRAQPPGGSYESWPGEAHFQLDQSWSARRAYSCLKGLADWGKPFWISLPQGRFELGEPLGYDPNSIIDQPTFAQGILRIPMSAGVLVAQARRG